LHKEFHHFAYIIVADALYCKSTWIKEVLSIGMDAVTRVKDALNLFRICPENKEWKYKTRGI